MKINISISISIFLSNGSAFGNVSGDLDMNILPLVGDKIIFDMNDDEINESLPEFFTGVLKVVGRGISLEKDKEVLLIELSEIIAENKAIANRFIKYFEKKLGFFGDIY